MTDEDKAEMHARLTQLEVGQTNLGMEVRANTKMVAGMQEDQARILDDQAKILEANGEMLELLTIIKASLKVLSALGGVAKWTASIGTAIGMLYAALHGNVPK